MLRLPRDGNGFCVFITGEKMSRQLHDGKQTKVPEFTIRAVCGMTHRLPVQIWQQVPRLLCCVRSSMLMKVDHTMATHRDTSRARSKRETSQNNKEHGFFFVVGRNVETATAVFLLRMCLESRVREQYSPLSYTWCPGRKVPDFGRMFLKLKYTDMTQNTYIQS